MMTLTQTDGKLANMAAQLQTAMNARHLAGSASWISPPWIPNAAREVMDGVIHLDPASSAQANDLSVDALMYFDKEINGLKTPWSHSLPEQDTLTNIYLNPPGGWESVQIPQQSKCKKTGVPMLSNVAQSIQVSRVKLWWQRLLSESVQDYFAQALFLSFSIESMQTTQVECERSVLTFPTCTFRSRVGYINPETSEVESGMTHSSAITYIPGRVDRTKKFLDVFAQYGVITVPCIAKAA
jgi:hypothetical protein